MNFTPTSNPDNRFIPVCDPQKESFCIGLDITQYFYFPFNWDDFVEECEVTYRQGLTIILTKQVEKESQTYDSCAAKVTLTSLETSLFQDNLLTVQVQAKVINVDGETSFYGPWEIEVTKPITGETCGNDDLF